VAFLILAPAFAQAPDPQAKPDAAAAQAPAKADDKAALAADKPADKPAESPAPATDSWFTGSVDLGYRWLLSNSGNFAQYRSVVNLGDGPKLFGLDFSIVDPKKRLFDRIDARANAWGGDPYNTAHLDIRKQGVYTFTADYRNIAYFNAVPSFANPFQPNGFNEQSFDIHRRNYSFALDVLPGKPVSFYTAYDRNSGFGSGIATWVQDSNNEYAVPAKFRDGTNNFRFGSHIEMKRFHVTLEHGITRFRDDDSAFNNVQTTGDNSTPLLGQKLYLNGLVETYGIRGSGFYDKGLLTASPFSWLDIYGQFLYSYPQINVSFTDLAQGNFAQLSSLLFYSTQSDVAAGTAHQPHVTGNFGFELRPLKRLRIIESVTTDRSHDAASPLITEQILAAGMTPQNIVTALNYKQIVNYNQEQVDVLYDLTSRLTLRGGYRLVWGDATVLAGQLSQTGNLVQGQLHRNVGLAGASFRVSKKLTTGFDYEGASSDNIYFRTSLNNYNKARARANFQATQSLSVQVRFQVLDNQNPAPSIRYDYLSRDNAVSLIWTPAGGKRISAMGEYDRSTLRSDIIYLGLFLAPGISAYRDNAHTATSAIALALPGYSKAKLTFGGSLFISSGSRPSRYYQPLARLSVPIQNHVSWNTEWQWYGYGEQFYLFEGFRTHIFMTGLRLSK
jgi:hypothetical protein